MTSLVSLPQAQAVASTGATVQAFRVGEAGRPAVVLASACGMPVQLCGPWMARLAEDHEVITWQTRGLFGGPDEPARFDGLATDVAAQVDDLFAVMDHFGVGRAHLMGLCGGAVIALRAAAQARERVGSLSLWHGDFSGSGGPVTDHQENLRALLGLAVAGRDDAAMINEALASSHRGDVPAEIADLVGYPYRTDELFYRYSLLTLATMTADVTPVLADVTCPVLVVTSQDDHTAHPAGSHRVAAALLSAQLQVEPHGDHISVFGASGRLAGLLAQFLAGPGECRP